MRYIKADHLQKAKLFEAEPFFSEIKSRLSRASHYFSGPPDFLVIIELKSTN